MMIVIAWMSTLALAVIATASAITGYWRSRLASLLAAAARHAVPCSAPCNCGQARLAVTELVLLAASPPKASHLMWSTADDA
jgi:hypothetical protein